MKQHLMEIFMCYRTLFTVCFLLYSVSLLGAESQPAPEVYKKLERLQGEVLKVIKDESSSPQKCVEAIKRLEKAAEAVPYLINPLGVLVSALRSRSDNDEIYECMVRIAQKVAFLSLKKFAGLVEEDGRIRSEYTQIHILMSFPLEMARTKERIDCNPNVRKVRVSRVLDLYFDTLALIDDSYDPNTEGNLPILSLSGFIPPATYEGRRIPGDYANSKDKATRDAFLAYREKMSGRSVYRSSQLAARDTRKRFADEIPAYLINAYSLFPYRTAELEQMLKEKKVDAEMTKQILEAVRKAEQENPDKGFRIWLSKDKLFKTTAKFISLDKGDVLLEKEDGKRTTIELSALRQEDQEYVKEQIKMNEQPK